MGRSSWVWALCAGLGLTPLYLLLPSGSGTQSVFYLLLHFAALGCLVAGIRSHRPQRAVPWHLLMIAHISYLTGDIIWQLWQPSFPSPADLFYVIGYSLFVAALSVLVRQRTRGQDRAGFLDSLIVTMGMAVLSGVFLMAPYVRDTTLPLVSQAVSLAYPVLDMALVGVLIRLVFIPAKRDPSFWLLSSAFLAQLTADTVYAVTLLKGTFYFGHPLELAYLTSFVLMGAAALCPSMSSLAECRPIAGGAVSRWRLGVLGAAALIAPAVLIVGSIRGAPQYVPLIALISALIFILVLARVAELTSDIDERRRVEGKLRVAEARFRELVEQLPGIVYEADPGPEGRWTYVSPRLRDMLGYEPEEWMAHPRSWLDAIHPGDRDQVIAEEAGAIELEQDGKAIFKDEYRMMARDGRILWVSDEAVLGRDADGNPAFFRGVLFDITGRKALEEQLLQSQKMEAVGQLAAGVAHDFNNLLSIVINYGRFVADDLDPGDPRREDLEEVIKAGERGARLARQLLTFSRRKIAEPEVMDLNALVRDMQGLLTRTIREQIVLSTQLAPELWEIKQDAGEMEQVLMNLAVNAKDSMPTGGTLAIRTENRCLADDPDGPSPGLPPGDYVRFTISDSGAGMPESIQNRIFEPFFTTKPKGRGTGLGLAIVYGIVRQGHGDICVESQVGEGTKFTIYLPRSVDRATGPGGHGPVGWARGDGRVILVAEDEEAVRQLVVRLLTGAGYRVLAAEGGLRAVELAAAPENRIDLLLADVIMPDISGPEVAARTGLPTVYMSGHGDTTLAEHGVLGGRDALLHKPFSADELMTTIESTFSRRGVPS